MIVLVESNMNCFLIISGKIAESKRREFEQTFRLVSSTMAKGCLMHNLATDVNKEGYYHFFSLWSNDDEMKKFTESEEYLLMNGAFHALGFVEESWIGNIADRKKLCGDE
jgi:quinol monooxygenase YgiN